MKSSKTKGQEQKDDGTELNMQIGPDVTDSIHSDRLSKQFSLSHKTFTSTNIETFVVYFLLETVKTLKSLILCETKKKNIDLNIKEDMKNLAEL